MPSPPTRQRRTLCSRSGCVKSAGAPTRSSGAVTASPWARRARRGRASCSRGRARCGESASRRRASPSSPRCSPSRALSLGRSPPRFPRGSPTASRNRGAGEKAQKALTDLVLYRHGHDEPALAVEFKSGGRSGRSEVDEGIRKDVAKVLAEQPDALWFHVVRDANSADSLRTASHAGRGDLPPQQPRPAERLPRGGQARRAARQADRLPRLRAQPGRDRLDPPRARLPAGQAGARLLHLRCRDDRRPSRDGRRPGLGRLPQLSRRYRGRCGSPCGLGLRGSGHTQPSPK